MAGRAAAVLRRARAWIDAREASFFAYMAATVASALLSFYSVRYVIAFLSKEQYGLWGYYAAISAMLVPVASLSLPQAMMRMYFDRHAGDARGQASLVTTTALLNLGGAILVAAAAAAAYLAAGRHLPQLLYFGGATTGGVALAFFTYLTRVRNDYGLYFVNRVLEIGGFMALAACATAVASAGGNTLGLGAARLSFLAGGLAVVLWSLILVNLVWYVRGGVLSGRVPRLAWAEVRAMFAFSAPLSGTYFLGWALASSDIWILRRMSTLVETADYVFAVGIASMVSLVTQSALTDWPRFYYAQMRDARPDRDETIARRVRLFLWLHVVAILAVRLVARFAYDLLGADAYTAGLEYVNYLILGNFFFLSGNLFAAGISHAKRTSLTLIAFAVPALLNLGLNAWLVPLWGARAAAVTTLLAYAVFAALCFALGRPFYRFTDVRGIVLVTAAACLVALLPTGL